MKNLLLITLATLLLAACSGGDDNDQPEGMSLTASESATADASPEPTTDDEDPLGTASPPVNAGSSGSNSGGAGGNPDGIECPDLSRVEMPGANATEEAVAAIASEDADSQLTVDDVIAGPAEESPYALIVADVCGQDTVDLSWFVRVCTVPCSEETSASLPTDLFLVKEEGDWRVYYSY